MEIPNFNLKELIECGVHFGHKTQKWNPKMEQYIHSVRENVHIIDLTQTMGMLTTALDIIQKTVAKGGKILFVATKKQAKEIVSKVASNVNMPYITERWPGGMLTNFVTIRKAVKKMSAIDRTKQDGTFEALSKREKLQIDRLRAKLEKNLGSITDMTRLPGALFVVDIRREHIAVREAQKLNIPIFAMVDTNCDPREVDFAIPSNDDASKSIDIILNYVTDAIKEGLSERQKEKEVAEVIKEKESGSEKKNEVSEDQKEDVKEVKEKKKRTRVAKKTEE